MNSGATFFEAQSQPASPLHKTTGSKIDGVVIPSAPFSPKAPQGAGGSALTQVHAPVLSSAERIRVVVRIRPQSATTERFEYKCVERTSDTSLSIKRLISDGGSNGSHDAVSAALNAHWDQPKDFTYDQVFDDTTSQAELYRIAVAHIVTSVIQLGCDATICAYGQTGSGKSYTILGAAPNVVEPEEEESTNPLIQTPLNPHTPVNELCLPPMSIGEVPACTPPGMDAGPTAKGAPDASVSRSRPRSLSVNTLEDLEQSWYREQRSNEVYLRTESGVLLRILMDIFDYKNKVKEHTHFTVVLSALELYMEEVRDMLGTAGLGHASTPGSVSGGNTPSSHSLMSGTGGGGYSTNSTSNHTSVNHSTGGPTNKVYLRDSGDEIRIPNLTLEIAENLATAIQTFDRARENRVVGKHKLNDASSRSHAIFNIDIFQQPRTDTNPFPPPDEVVLELVKKENRDTNKILRAYFKPSNAAASSTPHAIQHARLTVVDLAGSERVKQSGVEGSSMDEARYINRSLFALKQVVKCLFEGKRVPYRNANLTKLMRHSFANPTSHVLLIANISPTTNSHDQSIGTLRFADDVKNLVALPSGKRTQGKEQQEAQYIQSLRRCEAICGEVRVATALYGFPVPTFIEAISSSTRDALHRNLKDFMERRERQIHQDDAEEALRMYTAQRNALDDTVARRQFVLEASIKALTEEVRILEQKKAVVMETRALARLRVREHMHNVKGRLLEERLRKAHLAREIHRIHSDVLFLNHVKGFLEQDVRDPAPCQQENTPLDDRLPLPVQQKLRERWQQEVEEYNEAEYLAGRILLARREQMRYFLTLYQRVEDHLGQTCPLLEEVPPSLSYDILQSPEVSDEEGDGGEYQNTATSAAVHASSGNASANSTDSCMIKACLREVHEQQRLISLYDAFHTELVPKLRELLETVGIEVVLLPEFDEPNHPSFYHSARPAWNRPPIGVNSKPALATSLAGPSISYIVVRDGKVILVSRSHSPGSSGDTVLGLSPVFRKAPRRFVEETLCELRHIHWIDIQSAPMFAFTLRIGAPIARNTSNRTFQRSSSAPRLSSYHFQTRSSSDFDAILCYLSHAAKSGAQSIPIRWAYDEGSLKVAGRDHLKERKSHRGTNPTPSDTECPTQGSCNPSETNNSESHTPHPNELRHAGEHRVGEEEEEVQIICRRIGISPVMFQRVITYLTELNMDRLTWFAQVYRLDVKHRSASLDAPVAYTSTEQNPWGMLRDMEEEAAHVALSMVIHNQSEKQGEFRARNASEELSTFLSTQKKYIHCALWEQPLTLSMLRVLLDCFDFDYYRCSELISIFRKWKLLW